MIGYALTVAFCTVLDWTTPRAVSAAKPEVITNSIGMKLVAIPAGKFQMGAEEDRADTLSQFPTASPKFLDRERPRHMVQITKSFYMGQHEVTLNQFMKFYRAADYELEIERDGKASSGIAENGNNIESNRFRPWEPLAWKPEIDHPVIYVSWNDAVAFCEWLSKKEGKTYRLPTEAEWEYSCRAGTSSRFHFGNDQEELIRFANAPDKDHQNERERGHAKAMTYSYDRDGKKIDASRPVPYLSRRDGYAWMAPVGKFRPNAFGLYDMHGNASEWCSDWYGEDYYAQSPTDDPQGPSAGSSRVTRGGSCAGMPWTLRCASSFGKEPSDRALNLGFRVVCVR